MNDYQLREMTKAFSAWLNTIFDKEGEDIAAFRAWQAKLMEKVVYAYPKAIWDIKPEYGFHFESRGYEKVAEMDRVRQQYVRKVDGGTMPEVYAAYSDWLNATRDRAEQKYRRDVASLEKRNPADRDARLASLEANWKKAKRSYVVKKTLIEDHMQETSWYGQDQDKVIRRPHHIRQQ